MIKRDCINIFPSYLPAGEYTCFVTGATITACGPMCKHYNNSYATTLLTDEEKNDADEMAKKDD